MLSAHRKPVAAFEGLMLDQVPRLRPQDDKGCSVVVQSPQAKQLILQERIAKRAPRASLAGSETASAHGNPSGGV